MSVLAIDGFSRSARMMMAADAPTGGGGKEDPAIAIYRRFVETMARHKEIIIRTREIQKIHGFDSAEYQQIEEEADAMLDRSGEIYRELVETPVTSPTGLLLLFEAMGEFLGIRDDGGRELRGFENIAAGMRRLFPPKDLEVAEQLLSARKSAEI